MISEKNLKSNSVYKIPGKTFLVGEYAVLAGGSCLGLATTPCFEIQSKVDGQLFHPESAAGLYHQVNHKFVNPYQVGGFGASTAEFIFSYTLKNENLNPKQAFSTYLDIYKTNLSQKPSGADLLTQLVGGVAHIDLSDVVPKYEKLNWDFLDLDFLIYSTGLKVKTHEHLKNLDRKICETLVGPSQGVVDVFKSKNTHAFKDSIREWSKNLEQLSLTHSSVLELKDHLETKINSIVVKPCGALGADVILILCNKNEKTQIKNQIQQLNIAGLEYKADSQSLTDGFLMIL